jgi:hypothetical protein
MSVSRKSPGGDDCEMTTADYLADKADCQDRTGYAPRDEKELAQKAVDEKLLGGSQTY